MDCTFCGCLLSENGLCHNHCAERHARIVEEETQKTNDAILQSLQRIEMHLTKAPWWQIWKKDL